VTEQPPPRVTVVTPTYRRRETLLRAARSVAAQTGVTVEHVVVGDRCPDLPDLQSSLYEINPAIAILQLPDWRHPMASYTSARIARARNAGIVAAGGDYVCQLDSDNTLDPDHCRYLVTAIDAVPDAVGATCGRKLLFSDGRPFDLPFHPWEPTLETARATWERLRDLGVYQSGSHNAAERLSIDGAFFGVDAGEMMLRRETHLANLFPTRFDREQQAEGLGEDELLCRALFDQKLTIVDTTAPTVNFYLGGQFTAPLEALVRRDGPAAPVR